MNMKLLYLCLAFISLNLVTKDSEGQIRPTPTEVTSAFTKLFPDAANVMWRDKITNFCVYFNIKAVKCEAKFSPDGKWLSTEKSLQWDSLPPFVTDSLKTGKYADWKGTSAFILQSAAGTTQYHVVVTNNDLGRKILFFNENGRLLSDH
jgi:Putative beta-lactamase-inhibitor-like, PepSY-like